MASVIEKQVKGFPPEQRAVLLKMRDLLLEIMPGADETIAWGMPALEISGVTVLCFHGFKKHNSLFPMSGAVSKELADELSVYSTSKGTIQFDLHKAMPKSLLRKIVALRIQEINEGYPKKNGEYLHFHSNGALHSKGRYKGGERHGKWEWYRKDGTLLKAESY